MPEIILTNDQRAARLYSDRLDQLKERLMEYGADLIDMETPDPYKAAEAYKFVLRSQETPATCGAGARFELYVRPGAGLCVFTFWALHADSRKWLPIWHGELYSTMGERAIYDAFDRAEAVLALINAV